MPSVRTKSERVTIRLAIEAEIDGGFGFVSRSKNPLTIASSSERCEINNLLAIIAKACAASATERYASITAMLTDLEAVEKAIKRQA